MFERAHKAVERARRLPEEFEEDEGTDLGSRP